jgi:hypothetical protein
VKRTSLIIMVLGTALALAPAASAMHLSDGSGGGVGSGTVPAKVTDGWMSSLTLAPTPVILHTDVLGGDGGASMREAPTAADGDSFAWSTAGIGVVTLASVLLLMLATTEVTRRRHRLSI